MSSPFAAGGAVREAGASLRDDPARASLAVALRALAADGGVEITVRGRSMEPRLRDGDRVRVRRARFLLPGDVVVLRHGGSFVIHRLLGGGPRRAGWRLLTQGDTRPRPDGWIDPERVIGVADAPCPLPWRLRSFARFAGAVARGLRRRLVP